LISVWAGLRDELLWLVDCLLVALDWPLRAVANVDDGEAAERAEVEFELDARCWFHLRSTLPQVPGRPSLAQAVSRATPLAASLSTFAMRGSASLAIPCLLAPVDSSGLNGYALLDLQAVTIRF
jgi:hypothetical protein